MHGYAPTSNPFATFPMGGIVKQRRHGTATGCTGMTSVLRTLGRRLEYHGFK